MTRIRTMVRSILVVTCVVTGSVALANPQDLSNALRVISDANKATSVLSQAHQQLEAPTPIRGNSGAFMSPYRCNGTPTEWSNKAMGAVAGAVPSSPKEPTAQQSAVDAAGGWDFIKRSSDLSFDSLDDMAVYLQARHSSDADYPRRIAAAFSIYPQLQQRFVAAVDVAAKASQAKGESAVAATMMARGDDNAGAMSSAATAGSQTSPSTPCK